MQRQTYFPHIWLHCEGPSQKQWLLGMVAHATNSSTERLRQEDQDFEVSLGLIARIFLSNKDNNNCRTPTAHLRLTFLIRGSPNDMQLSPPGFQNRF